jgi:deoxyhypusine synthase
MRKIETLDNFPQIKGYDFEQPFNLDRFLESYATTGIQATNLAKGIEIANQMIEQKATIFLTMTSNMVSSGLREVIKFLVKHKMVHCVVASAGAIEEDIIKTMKPFVVGSFDVSGMNLYEKGVGRIGNIFAPFDRYLYFENFMKPFFDRIYDEQKKRNSPFTPSEFVFELGKEVGKNELHEDSILYWATKNNIPVFCPALTDGSTGDLLYFQKVKRADFYLDIVGDSKKIIDFVIKQDKTGAIILGGSVPKHFVLNANIFKNGLDYAVYITTAQEYDASDSGGNEEEAKSWAKIRLNAAHVKIRCEASIAFPLLVAGSFAKNHKTY